MTTHSAPPVQYPFARSVFLRAVLFALWAIGAAAIGFWICFGSVSAWSVSFALAAVAFAGFAAASGWAASPIGQLAWDGQLWRWQSAAYSTGVSSVELVLQVDLQRFMWLRLENSAGASLWLWAEKSALPYRWMDLRRAVVTSSGASAALLASAL